ncbi:MAG: pilus assembly protein PilP [Myxococcota bacterium]
MQNKWIALACALTLVVGLAGCGEEEVQTGKPTAADFENDRTAMANRDSKKKPGQKKAKKAKAKKGKKGSKAAPAASGYAVAEQDYFYDPRGKRDPFRSFRFVTEEDSDAKKISGPLGDFELGQLELSAVIWDAGNPRALIIDPGGRSFIVREGSQIGKNSGQVIHIGDSLVLVKETYENFAGEQTTKDVELRISLNQGG